MNTRGNEPLIFLLGSIIIRSRVLLGALVTSPAADSTLTGISVAYANQLKPPIRLSRRARAGARRNMRNDGEPIKPFGMSSTRRRIAQVDPKQNNINDIGAKIIPQGQGQM